MTHHDSLLRQFLLGRLEEPERRRLELEMLEDDVLFERVEAIEGDLLVDLGRGALPADEAEVLRTRLLSSREGRRQRAFHHGLGAWLRSREAGRASRRRSAAGGVVAPRRGFWSSRVASGLVAALLTLAVALPLFRASQSAMMAENRSLSDQLAELRADEARAPLRSTYVLSPLTRSDQQTASFRIGGQTEFVELWLAPPDAADGAFRVEVRQAGELLLHAEVALLERDWGPVVPLELELDAVSRGPLEILLERFDGSWSPVASYSVEIERR